MEDPNKDIKNQIEEAKYQLRIEIAEKCLIESIRLSSIVTICSFTEDEIKHIARSLERKSTVAEEMIMSKEKKKIEVEQKQQRLKMMNKLKKELKRLEKEHLSFYQKERQKEADLNRKIAAEQTRILMQKTKQEKKEKKEKKEQQKREKNEAYLKTKEEKRLMKEREKELKNHRLLEEESKKRILKEKITEIEPSKTSSSLNAEQEMILTVGNCYLKGLSVKEAILISKATEEDVKQIYNSFKNL